MDWILFSKTLATIAMWASVGYFSKFKAGGSILGPLIVTTVMWV